MINRLPYVTATINPADFGLNIGEAGRTSVSCLFQHDNWESIFRQLQNTHTLAGRWEIIAEVVTRSLITPRGHFFSSFSRVDSAARSVIFVY